MNILVTGYRGFIGSYLVDRLQTNSSYHVVGVDIEDTYYGFKNNIVDVEWDVIFHLAAVARTQECNYTPFDKPFYSNVLLSNNIFKHLKFKQIVYTSSCAIYGDQEILPITELNLPNCPSIYAAQKLYSEQFIHFTSVLNTIDSICLRLFNVYGPGQSQGGLYPNVIASLIKSYKNNDYIEITGSGEQTRDFVYITDVIDALIGCMNLGGNYIYNVCTGVETSINTVGRMITNKVMYIKERDFDIRRQVGSFNKINKALRWYPKVDLNSGLLTTLDIEL